MNKFIKLTCFVMILMFVLVFSACQNNTIDNISTEIELEDGSGTGILAENDTVDFYFYYPENCVIHRNDAMIMIYTIDEDILQTNKKDASSGDDLFLKTKPNLSATVFALPNGKYETINDYWNDFALPSFEGLFQEMESEEDLTVDGVDAKKYTYTLSISGMKYKFSQIIFFNKRQVYTLTYTATEAKYSSYINVLNTVAETFKFK